MNAAEITNRHPISTLLGSTVVRIRSAKGYDLAVRSLGSAWFLMLALVMAQKTVGIAVSMNFTDFGPNGWPALVSSVCLLLFYMSLWRLMLSRTAPVASTDGIIPSLIAFAGGYLPWAIPLLAPPSVSAGQSLLSAALVLTGATLMVVTIFHLGHSFSIIPQARSLVRTGPYAIIRNPLYLAEEIAILGTLLQYYSAVTLLVFLAHGALQVRRISYEEKLLHYTFPDYSSYAESTSRLIPYIW